MIQKKKNTRVILLTAKLLLWSLCFKASFFVSVQIKSEKETSKGSEKNNMDLVHLIEELHVQ